MKSRRLLMVVSASVLLSGCGKAPMTSPPAPPTDVWKEASSAEWGFSISLPGTPREETKTLANGSPQFNFILNLTDPIYVVAVNKLPAGSDRKEQADKLLEVGRDKAVANVKGTLLSDKALDLPPHFRGREFLVQGGQDNYRRTRAFIAHDRFYVITVAGTKSAVSSADADRVLDSFKLLSEK